MKKTTSSLFAATAALGLIAASAGVAFAAEPVTDPSTSATDAPVTAEPSAPAADAPSTGTPAASNPTLANTGSVASIAAGAGVIALAGGVPLVVARKRH